MTKYRWRKVIDVEVCMMDDGEMFEGEPVKWESEEERIQVSGEYRDEAVTIWDDSCDDDDVTVIEGDWLLVEVS